MLLCNETVTLIQHDKQPCGDVFSCTKIAGASWFAKTAVALEDGGVKAANVVKVRIPEKNLPEGAKLQSGCYLVRGEVKQISGISDLKGREYIKIMTVGDNRRGRLRHWSVTGA